MKCAASARLSSPGHLAPGSFLFCLLSVAISEDAAQPFDLITLGEKPSSELDDKMFSRHNRHTHPLIGKGGVRAVAGAQKLVCKSGDISAHK